MLALTGTRCTWRRRAAQSCPTVTGASHHERLVRAPKPRGTSRRAGPTRAQPHAHKSNCPKHLGCRPALHARRARHRLGPNNRVEHKMALRALFAQLLQRRKRLRHLSREARVLHTTNSVACCAPVLHRGIASQRDGIKANEHRGEGRLGHAVGDLACHVRG